MLNAVASTEKRLSHPYAAATLFFRTAAPFRRRFPIVLDDAWMQQADVAKKQHTSNRLHRRTRGTILDAKAKTGFAMKKMEVRLRWSRLEKHSCGPDRRG